MSDVNEAGMREYGRCSACNRYFPASDDLHDVLREHAKTCAELAAQGRAARLRDAAPEMLAMLERAQDYLDSFDGPTPQLSRDVAALLVRLRGLKHP